MKRFLQLITILLMLSSVLEAKQNYISSLIADSLVINANAVIRLFETSYERETAEHYTKQVTFVVTVLNKMGNYAAVMAIPYNRNEKVTIKNAIVYNAYGYIIKKYKKNDILDSPNNASFTLFSDQRIKHLHPTFNSYPYTVEYSYLIESDATVGFAGWMPQNNYNIATEQAQLSISCPEALPVNAKELNYAFVKEVIRSNETINYRWKVSGIKAKKYESNSPHYSDIFPMVLLTPNNIAYEGSVGSFDSWNSYGFWVKSLIANRDHLTPNTVAEIHALTDTITNDYNKVKAIYKYMQNRTRYVNIALGIGGFQPLDAIDVDVQGYGDCKALSNYTKTLLSTIGIKAYYTEIGSGSNIEIRHPDFPSVNQTNHIILCVPLTTDTVWLECTSQNFPCDYLGNNSSNRYALCITDTGGKLVKTPHYKTEENIRSAISEVELRADGSADIDLHINYQNGLYSEIHSLIYSSNKDQRKTLLKQITAENVQITNFSITDSSDKNAIGNLRLQAIIRNYAIPTNKRLIITPNLLFKQNTLYAVSSDRECPIYRPIGVSYFDTIIINTPQNYETEFLPSSLNAPCNCGLFCIKYEQLEKDKIAIYRKLIIKDATFGKDMFIDITKFANKVYRHTKDKIILKLIDEPKQI